MQLIQFMPCPRCGHLFLEHDNSGCKHSTCSCTIRSRQLMGEGPVSEQVVQVQDSMPHRTIQGERLSFLTYENRFFGLKIQYPSDWECVEFGHGAWNGSIRAVAFSSPRTEFYFYHHFFRFMTTATLVIDIWSLNSQSNISLQSIMTENVDRLKSRYKAVSMFWNQIRLLLFLAMF